MRSYTPEGGISRCTHAHIHACACGCAMCMRIHRLCDVRGWLFPCAHHPLLGREQRELGADLRVGVRVRVRVRVKG